MTNLISYSNPNCISSTTEPYLRGGSKGQYPTLEYVKGRQYFFVEQKGHWREKKKFKDLPEAPGNLNTDLPMGAKILNAALLYEQLNVFKSNVNYETQNLKIIDNYILRSKFFILFYKYFYDIHCYSCVSTKNVREKPSVSVHF